MRNKRGESESSWGTRGELREEAATFRRAAVHDRCVGKLRHISVCPARRRRAIASAAASNGEERRRSGGHSR